MLRVGILLAGCGAHDGTDLHEAVLLAAALERAFARVSFLAPDRLQADVVDHARGTTDDAAAPRSVLSESARIARGRIDALDERTVSDLSVVAVPGGVGVLKNFFADLLVPGRAARLHDDVGTPLAAFRARGGVLVGTGVAHAVLEALAGPLGIEPLSAPASLAVVDVTRRVGWAPGFLTANGLADVSRGIEDLCRALPRLCGAPRA